MKIAIVDTNVFLRYLTNDVPTQTQRIEKRFLQAKEGKFKIHVLQVTVVEVLFHLENWYKFSKVEAVEKTILLLSPIWIDVEGKDAVFEALGVYKNNTIDFVDLLTWAVAKNHQMSILSFDKHYDRLLPKLRIEP